MMHHHRSVPASALEAFKTIPVHTKRQRNWWKTVDLWRRVRARDVSSRLAKVYESEYRQVKKEGLIGLYVSRWRHILSKIYENTFLAWFENGPVAHTNQKADKSPWTLKISRKVKAWMQKRAEKLVETSRKVLQQIYDSKEDVARKLRDQYTNWKGSRAILQSRDIVVSAVSFAQQEQAKQKNPGKVPEFEWITMEDERVRPTHAEQHGEIRPEGEPFSNGCLYPGDLTAPPEEVHGCRCTLFPV